MTFGQFLAIVRARWLVALIVLLVTVVTTLAISLSLTKQYRAQASVVVDFKPDPVSAVIFGGMATPAFMATQVDIIQSERVGQRVMRNLKLNENPGLRQQWMDDTNGAGSFEGWIVSSFGSQMDVLPSRESSVITIGYRHADPRTAALLANAFVQAYVDTTLELRVGPARQYSTFFETRAKEAREALEVAQGRLSKFQNDNGIIASDERLDVENARLNELSSQYTTLQAIAAESGSRQAQANSAQGDRLAEVLNNPLVAGLKSDISRGDARLQELSTRLGDAHPQVQEAKANLNELRARLDAETRKVTGSVGMNNTINQQREGEIRRSLEAQRAKVLKLKAVRDEGLVIIRDVENAQRAYDAIQARYTQTNLEGQATQSNVNVLTLASPPLQHSTPKVGLNTILALVVGSLLAIGTALALELRDRRVRSAEDLVNALKLPVIGLMPKPGMRMPLGARKDSDMQHRLLAPLPQPAKGA